MDRSEIEEIFRTNLNEYGQRGDDPVPFTELSGGDIRMKFLNTLKESGILRRVYERKGCFDPTVIVYIDWNYLDTPEEYPIFNASSYNAMEKAFDSWLNNYVYNKLI